MAGFGLRLCQTMGMTDGYAGGLKEMLIDPADTNPIFTGDPVALTAGYVEEATGAASNNDFSIYGVFMGCRYVDADGSYVFKNRWDGGAGRTEIKAHVAIPMNGTFLIKGTTGQVYTQADIGVRKGVVYAAGSTQSGDSRISLGAAGATVATGPLMVQGLAELPGNSFAIDEPVFLCTVVRQSAFFTAA